MNLYYSNIFYNNIITDESINFGVIVHDNNKAYFKFDLSDKVFQKIKHIGENVDPDTFLKLNNTFQHDFLDKKIIVATDSEGKTVEFRTDNIEFLDYLHNYKKGAYRFTAKNSIFGEIEPHKVLDKLFNLL